MVCVLSCDSWGAERDLNTLWVVMDVSSSWWKRRLDCNACTRRWGVLCHPGNAWSSVEQLPRLKEKVIKVIVKRLTRVTRRETLKVIAISSHAPIVHVTVKLMRCCNSCYREHRIKLLISGKADLSSSYIPGSCEERRDRHVFCELPTAQGVPNLGRLGSLGDSIDRPGR